MSQPPLLTVSTFRRGYGRRYTDLPVDQLERDFFSIDCTGASMRPELYDLRAGDLVRWRQGDRYAEAVIAAVRQEGSVVRAELRDAQLLHPDYFPY